MSAFISTFKPGSYEHEQLRIAAELLTQKSPTKTDYKVGETYFDYGQNWKWTTILALSPKLGVYQALTPREQEQVILSHDLNATTDEYFTDRLCLDKVE